MTEPTRSDVFNFNKNGEINTFSIANPLNFLFFKYYFWNNFKKFYKKYNYEIPYSIPNIKNTSDTIS